MINNENMIAQIEAADRFVDKRYMESLREYQVKELEDFEKKYNLVRLLHVSKIVYDKNEDINEKLISVFNAVMPFCKNFVLIIKGNKNSVMLYIGIRATQISNTATAIEVLRDAFLGNFPGSKMKIIKTSKVEEIFKMNGENEDTNKNNVAYMNILPSERNNTKGEFTQGLEKFIDTMKGKEYICEIIASPLSSVDIQNRLSGFEELYSALYPFSKKTSSHGHNKGESLTKGITQSISQSISQGISRATGKSEGHSHGTNSSVNVGVHMLLNFGMSEGTQESWNTGTNEVDSTSVTQNESVSDARQESETVTTGTTDNLTIEFRNKGIEDLLEKIEKHIKRLKLAASYGMWETSSYFIAQEKKTVAIAASTYRSLLLGEETGIENANFTLFDAENEDTKIIEETLHYCMTPRFKIPSFIIDNKSTNVQIISPTNYINGKELPLLFNFPRKSVSGIIVTEMAEFGRNVLKNDEKNARSIKIGNIFYMGNPEEEEVNLNVDSLTSHCFVTGSTGSGKSNTIYKIIENVSMSDYDIPFLVIEPAKGEYRNEFRKLEGINLFTTNPYIDQMLKLNPFSFNKKIHILEHLDRLIEIFNGCWEMYAAMPAILKEAMEEAYVSKGWDLLNSVYTKKGEVVFPTFLDVLQELPKIINSSQYSADTKGDYIGALVTRVNSMTNGIYGQIFCDDFEVEEKTLFDERTIVDLSRIGSSETKSLIMGILILKLNEYRMANAKRGNSKLRHITILEEAHNILKNSQKIQGTAGNSIVSKSIEMIVNSIAEMRTYGEGFIIVDQSPTSVDIAAIKNTNTKIIMRLPEAEDCKIAGHAVSLNSQQVEEISKLETGVAVIMQNNWEQPVLSKIDIAENIYEGYDNSVSFSKLKSFNSMVLRELLEQYEETDEHDVEKIINRVEQFDITSAKKIEMIRMIKQFTKIMNEQYDSVLFGRIILRLVGCDDAFKNAEKKLRYDKKSSDIGEKLYTKESFSEWYVAIDDALSQYADVDEKQRETIRQYILHCKKFENHSINYRTVYCQLYNYKK